MKGKVTQNSKAVQGFQIMEIGKMEVTENVRREKNNRK